MRLCLRRRPFDERRGPVTRRLRADLALLGVTLVWGSTFVLMQESVRLVPPYRLLSWRFAVASLALIILSGRRLWHVPRRDLLAAGAVGVLLFAGYAFQTIGLQYTTAARSGFITGLTVVLVPLVALVVTRQGVPAGALVGVGLATVGLFLLSWPGWGGADAVVLYGDLVTLGCTLAFALQIVLVGRLAPRMGVAALTTAQVVVVALLSTVLSLTEPPTGSLPLWLPGSVIFLGLAATALAFAVQARAQRFTTPTHTALIFAMEPVFAAFFAWILVGELLGGRALVGCALILTGMIVAEARS